MMEVAVTSLLFQRAVACCQIVKSCYLEPMQAVHTGVAGVDQGASTLLLSATVPAT